MAISLIIITFLLISISIISFIIELFIDIEFSYGIRISTDYIDYFDLSLPTIEVFVESDKIALLFKFNLFSVNFGFTNFSDDIWNNPSKSGLAQSFNPKPKASGSDSNLALEFLDGMGDTFGLCGGIYAVYAAGKVICRNSWQEKLFEIIQMVVWGFCVGAFIAATILDDEEENDKEMGFSLLGMALGFFISGCLVISGSFLACVSGLTLITKEASMIIYLIFQVFDFLFDLTGMTLDFLDIFEKDPLLYIEAPTSFFTGILSLLVGISAVMVISLDSEENIGGSWPGLWLGLVSFAISAIMFIWSAAYFV